MTGERRIWTIGGLSRDDAGWAVTEAHKVTEVEFAELERKVTFVVELASQRDYGRLLAAVARLDALLETAREDLETEGRLSPCSAAALPLDVTAVVEAARRLETALVDKIDAAADLPRQVASAFHGVRHGIRASGSYLVAYELADRGGRIKLVLRDGAVHFDGRGRNSAQQVARGLLGLLFSLVRAYLSAFRERFDRTGASPRENLQFRNIPTQEMAALRRFYSEGGAAQTPEELVQAALALAGACLRTDLHVGDADIADGVVDGDATDAVNQFPTARFEVDLRLLGSTPIDYWGPVNYRVAQSGQESELFAGAVQAAFVENDRADVVAVQSGGVAEGFLAEAAVGTQFSYGMSEKHGGWRTGREWISCPLVVPDARLVPPNSDRHRP